MCAADKPTDLSNDGIVHDGAKQRAWRAAKLREAIDNQTPSEIMEARTGEAVPRFGIDGLDEPEGKGFVRKKPIGQAPDSVQPSSDGDGHGHTIAAQPAFTAQDIEALAKAINDTVFLLPEQGLVFTKAQLALELGVTTEAMAAMTDEGYERLGLVQIRPYN
jgi:hypothetical protein